MEKITRDKIIQEIYRSLRDNGFSPFNLVARDKNSLVIDTHDHRINVSFRINIEEKQREIE